MTFKKASFLIALCSFLLIVDVLTKAYAYYYLSPLGFSSSVYPYGGIGVFKGFWGVDFSINYAMNKGAAWGMLASFQQALLYARLIIITALSTYILVGKMPYLKRLSLSLIAIGAIGNVIDYFVYGHVVDMFYFVFWGYSYPVFNIADSSIFLGVCVLFIYSFLEKKSRKLPLKNE